MNPVAFNGQSFNINKKNAFQNRSNTFNVDIHAKRKICFCTSLYLQMANCFANQRITLSCVCVSCVFSSFLNVCVNVVAVWHLHRCYQMKCCFFSSLSFSSFLSLPFPAEKNAKRRHELLNERQIKTSAVVNCCQSWQKVKQEQGYTTTCRQHGIWCNHFAVKGVCLYLFTFLGL